jgi:hypothetical protein
MKWKQLVLGAALVVALAFAAFQAYLYSIDYYASAQVHQTARGAIDGYDAVAYHTLGRPVSGSPQFIHDWNCARWQFASAEHLEIFRRNPELYAPRFGGYCAYAVGNGYTAKSDPQAWHIEDGRLYLNFDAAVREQWLARRAELIPAAERHWPAVLHD